VANPGQEDSDFDGTGDACECDCLVWGDVSGDGAINPVDVVYMVNCVYKSLDNRVQPPSCPYEAGDANCDERTNPIDVVLYVNRVYKSVDAFCPSPCQ